MEVWQGMLLAGAGAVAGFINVMAGGGSTITLPVMVLMGMPGPVANGTNRIAILSQNIAAVTGFFRQGFSDFKLSLTLAICSLPGAVAGAYLGTRFSGIWFNRFLAAIMIAIMVLMAIRKRTAANQQADIQTSRKRIVLAHILMVAAGFYGGFIQAGVGFIMMAILHKVLGLDLVRVNMHKIFIVGLYTIVALVVFAAKGQIAWAAGLFLAAGNAVGGWFGSHFAVKKGEKVIRLMLYVVLAVLAIKLILN